MAPCPWTVPFSWTPLALWAVFVAGRISRKGAISSALIAGCLLILADLLLDPGAVAQRFWRYDAGGAYYGVPLTNFLGWALTGSIGAALAGQLLSAAELPAGVALSGLLSLTFWTSVCLWMGLWIPGAIGLILVGGTLWLSRK